ALRRADAGGGVLRRHRADLHRRHRGKRRRRRKRRKNSRTRRREGAFHMITGMRAELVGVGGILERNLYLTRRYIWWEAASFVWPVANTLTIVFIAKGIEASGGTIDVNRVTSSLLIGAVIWAYLGIIFEHLTETVAWERWEGTIEYTFMAPLRRWAHLAGM